MILTIDEEIERQSREIREGKKRGDVRRALADGKTEFQRPVPGEARMYPETDLPLLRIGREKINSLKKNLPKLKNEIRDELKKKGLNDEMINLILDEGVDEFNTLMRVHDKDANLIAKMVVLWRNEFASKLKKNIDEINSILNERILEEILEKLNSGEIKESDIKQVMWDVVNGKTLQEVAKIESLDNDKLEEEITKIVNEKPGLRAGAYMGMIIAKLGAGIDKRKAMDILNKLLK